MAVNQTETKLSDQSESNADIEIGSDDSFDLNNPHFIRDKANLLNIFPKKVWLLIFSKFEDTSETLQILSNSSQYFRLLLQGKRTLFLFQNAWNILAIKEDPSNFHNDPTKPEAWLSSIRSVRLTCRSWCTAVNTFFLNLPHHFQIRHSDPTNVATFKGNAASEICQLSIPSYIKEMLLLVSYVSADRSHLQSTEKFEEKEKHPLFLKKMSIQLALTQTDNKSLEFLQKYGHHIWYCDIWLNDYIALEENYVTLCMALKGLPNLKTLVLKQDHLTPRHEPRPWLSEEEIANQTKKYPLPTLPQLQFLNSQNIDGPILKELLSRNSHISILEVQGTCIPSEDHWLLVPLPKLTKAAFELSSESELKYMETGFVPGTLQSAHLNFYNAPFMEWSRIFQVLQDKFAESLINLVIDLPKTKSFEEDCVLNREMSSMRLNLPLLNRLKVCMGNCSTLDFLLPMRYSLEILSLDVPFPDDFERWIAHEETLAIAEKEIIRFFDCVKNMEKSNIWILFPNLKEIHIQSGSDVVKNWYKTVIGITEKCEVIELSPLSLEPTL